MIILHCFCHFCSLLSQPTPFRSNSIQFTKASSVNFIRFSATSDRTPVEPQLHFYSRLWWLFGRIPVLPILHNAYCVPNLQLDDFAVHLNFFDGKLDSHGGVAWVVELVFGEGGEEGAFADGSVSDKNKFEDIVDPGWLFHLPSMNVLIYFI